MIYSLIAVSSILGAVSCLLHELVQLLVLIAQWRGSFSASGLFDPLRSTLHIVSKGMGGVILDGIFDLKS